MKLYSKLRKNIIFEICVHTLNVLNQTNQIDLSREMFLGLLSHRDQTNLSRLPRSESVWGEMLFNLLSHWDKINQRNQRNQTNQRSERIQLGPWGHA